MSEAKKGIVTWNKGRKGIFKHSTESLKRMSKRHKGGNNARAILREEQVEEILKEYIKKEPLENAGKLMKNGRIMSYNRAFSLKMSIRYNVHPVSIDSILRKKNWTHVSSKYQI